MFGKTSCALNGVRDRAQAPSLGDVPNDDARSPPHEVYVQSCWSATRPLGDPGAVEVSPLRPVLDPDLVSLGRSVAGRSDGSRKVARVAGDTGPRLRMRQSASYWGRSSAAVLGVVLREKECRRMMIKLVIESSLSTGNVQYREQILWGGFDPGGRWDMWWRI